MAYPSTLVLSVMIGCRCRSVSGGVAGAASVTLVQAGAPLPAIESYQELPGTTSRCGAATGGYQTLTGGYQELPKGGFGDGATGTISTIKHYVYFSFFPDVGEQHSSSESLGSFRDGIESESQVDHSESSSNEINSGAGRKTIPGAQIKFWVP
ncbi:hypothetical protein B0H12DRAFT_1077880 [Mycena haematopus]|nr:hypothetical protein B0H12DRAFT_1077880 [Mycena haematopus]